MSEYIVLKKIQLGLNHLQIGKTRHYIGNSLLPAACLLEIVKMNDVNEAGVYLIYYDEYGQEMTDTFHDTIEKAMAQAKWEYLVKPDEWVDIQDSK